MTLNAHYVGANNYQNSVNSDRKLVEFLVAGSSNTHGVTPGSFQVGPVAGQHQVTVGGAGSRAFLQGKNTPASQGYYHSWADTAEIVPLPVPQSNPYIATIILRVTDPQYGTVTGLVGARMDVVSGTPASSPSPVDNATIDALGVPGSWLRLADVRINPTDTVAIPIGQISDTRSYVPDRAGDPIQCLSTARPAGVRGRMIYEIDTGLIWVYGNAGAAPGWECVNPGSIWATAVQPTTTLTLTTGVWGNLVWDTFTGNGITRNPASNPHRLTVPVPGRYAITLRANLSGLDASLMFMRVKKNSDDSATAGFDFYAEFPTRTGMGHMATSSELTLAANDWITAQLMYQQSGSIAVNKTDYPRIEVQYRGPA